MKKPVYHHKWCGNCGGMTVHDAGVCTRCAGQEKPKEQEKEK